MDFGPTGKMGENWPKHGKIAMYQVTRIASLGLGVASLRGLDGKSRPIGICKPCPENLLRVGFLLVAWCFVTCGWSFCYLRRIGLVFVTYA